MSNKTMEMNKIAGAVLTGLLLLGSVNLLGNVLRGPNELAENAFPISVDGSASSAPKAEKPTGPEPIEGLLAAADLGKGAKVWGKCKSCHSIEAGGADKTGPALYGIVGADKARSGGFKYSSALASMEGVWGYNELNLFLAKPKDYVPGTKMGFAGLKKTNDRANLIAWMRTQSDAPIALPE